MSQQSNTNDLWRRMVKKALRQERLQTLQRLHDSVINRSRSDEELHPSNSAQDQSQPLAKIDAVRPSEALRTPKTRPEAPTKRPTSSHEFQPGKTCQTLTSESDTSSGRPGVPQHLQCDSTPFPEDDDWIEDEGNETTKNVDNESEDNEKENEGEDGCLLLYLFEELHKLRELDALPQSEREEE